MRRIFIQWLFVFVASAFVVTLAVIFAVQSYQAQENALALIALRIQDAQRQIETNQKNLDTIRGMNASEALSKARALAQLIQINPSYLSDAKLLGGLLMTLDVDEIYVVDLSGAIIATTNERYRDYNMNDGKQSAEFMGLTDGTLAELVQKPQPMGADQSRSMQYAGVPRFDENRRIVGLVQIGYYPERLQEAMELADIKSLAKGFRIGTNGMVVLCRDGRVVSAGGDIPGPTPAAPCLTDDLLAQRDFTVTIDGTPHIGKAERYDDYVMIGLLPVAEMYLNRNASLLALFIGFLLLFAVVFILISWLVNRVVISGIRRVNGDLARITAGDLGVRVHEQTSPEFGALSDGINATVQALADSIQREATRNAAELDVARTIQFSCIPNKFPAFPERTDLDLHALLLPAKQVGGDFYDFVLLEDDRLGFAIADVSGKGIPAAMFMMRAKAMLMSTAIAGSDLGGLVSQVNNQLCAGNDAELFVTALVGVLDLKTRDLVYVNAGHNPPYRIARDGTVSQLLGTRGLVLAGMEGYTYKTNAVKLAPGETLFLYTDGVTEATDNANRLFGQARLKACLEQTPVQPAKERIAAVNSRVAEFVGAAAQADDITMLAIRLVAGSAVQRLELPADAAELERIQDFVCGIAQRAGADAKTVNKLALVVEEVFVNMAHYAYGGQPGEAVVECEVDGEILTIRFSDRGVPYNPMDNPDPDLTLPAEERPIGGLGILLTRKFVDQVDYEFRDGRNILTLQKRLG